MNYSAFENVMSSKRMRRYLNACDGDKRKAQTLYRLNLRLSQEMFTVISCYEVALRNAIDRIMTSSLGKDWLREAILPGGIFDNPLLSSTVRIMYRAYNELITNGKYSSPKMLSAMEFGIWKYMFSAPQYRATGRRLLQIFPNKPKSSAKNQLNNQYIYNELDAINRVRNRIAITNPFVFSMVKKPYQRHTCIIATSALLRSFLGWILIPNPYSTGWTMCKTSRERLIW